jgi:F0F1-type ATP synthase membrane subunit b/b'
MKNKKTEESSGILKYTSIGVSLASLAAGAYFFFGPQAKKHQKHAKAWVIKMKGDVIEKLETAKEVTEPIYHAIIDAVAEDYNKRVENGQGDIAEIVSDLKKQWKTLSKALKPKTKTKAVLKKKVATVVKKA